MTKTTDEFQNGLSPIALTTLATHSGPVVLLAFAWSESWTSGTTQVTAASVPFGASVRICVCGETTSLCQSVPP